MDRIQAERLIKMNQDKLSPKYNDEMMERLLFADYTETAHLFSNLKTPSTATILSVILGGFSVDRFYIGDWLLGIIKLLTCGGCLIWWIADWFLIGSATRINNSKKILDNLPYAVTETSEVENVEIVKE